MKKQEKESEGQQMKLDLGLGWDGMEWSGGKWEKIESSESQTVSDVESEDLKCIYFISV